MAKNDTSKKARKDPPPTSQVTLLVRAILGAYLVYLAFDLRKDFSLSVVYVIAAAVFAVIGACLVITSVRRIFNGNYDLVDSKGERIDPDDLPEDEDEDDSLSWEELKDMGNDLSFLEEDSTIVSHENSDSDNPEQGT